MAGEEIRTIFNNKYRYGARAKPIHMMVLCVYLLCKRKQNRINKVMLKKYQNQQKTEEKTKLQYTGSTRPKTEKNQ